MILFQIGVAPVTPDAITGFIGELSLFPTHTPATIDGVYPIAQLSLFSSVVPVLTETVLPRTLRSDLDPNASVRALSSSNMCEIRNAISGDKTFLPSVFFAS